MSVVTGTWEDREQIRELYAQYAHTVDGGRVEEWLKCFTEDGVFESPIFGRHTGQQGLKRFTAIYKESLGGSGVRHVMTCVTFQIEGANATGSCYLNYYHFKDGKVRLAAIGGYNDTLRKVDGNWLFASRKVFIDGHS